MNLKKGDNPSNKNLSHVLVQNSPVGIVLIQDNKIVYQNAKSEEFLDVCLGMSVKQTFRNVYPEDLIKLRSAFEKILSKGCDDIHLEFRVEGSNHEEDKEPRWFLFLAKACIHEGRFAVLINLIDNSKAKKNAELINLIDRMSFFDQIAAGVAHEIRNPLTAISSYLYSLEEIIKDELDGSRHMKPIKAIIDQIEGASIKIESAIKNLMGTARIGLPKMISLNANESIEEVIDFTTEIFRQNDIKLLKSLADDLPSCYGDPHMAKQAILNLVLNACENMENNEGSNKLELKSFSKKNKIFISVSDSGPGISEKIKKRVSAPLSPVTFVEMDIELRIVQKIVALHSGSIQAKDSKWGGVELIIGLPINKRALPRS